MKFSAGGSRGTTLAWEVITIRVRGIFRYQSHQKEDLQSCIEKIVSVPVSQLNLGTQLLAELFLQLIES